MGSKPSIEWFTFHSFRKKAAQVSTMNDLIKEMREFEWTEHIVLLCLKNNSLKLRRWKSFSSESVKKRRRVLLMADFWYCASFDSVTCICVLVLLSGEVSSLLPALLSSLLKVSPSATWRKTYRAQPNLFFQDAFFATAFLEFFRWMRRWWRCWGANLWALPFIGNRDLGLR